MSNVAVILSGCGYLDGAEIREAVLSLLYLDQQGAKVQCFAADKNQHHVVNHLGGEESKEERHILQEAARIARGKVQPLCDLEVEAFDALVIPGGYGVAKNLSDLAFKGPECTVDKEFARVAQGFVEAGKPIGAICIASAVLVAALKEKGIHPTVTIGECADTAAAIEAMGGKHVVRASDEIAVDETHKIVSASAYMREDALAPIGRGIEKLVVEVLEIAIKNNGKDA